MTTIEIVCDACDEDEAGFSAGEYLRGNPLADVQMKCRTIPLKRQMAKRVFIVFMAAAVVASIFCGRGAVIASTGSGKIQVPEIDH